MTGQQVQALVNEIIAETVGVSVDSIGDVGSLIELGADSFHFVELVAHLEATFSINLPYELSEVGRQTATDYVMAVTQALCDDRGAD